MIEINNEVKKIMKQIESSGYEIYLVGGFVRDSIIGRENKDYDLCTNNRIISQNSNQMRRQ